MNPTGKKEVDHIDGNGLNNKKSNLRLCTNNQNLYNRAKCKNNTSGFKGVKWKKDSKKWVAAINVNNKRIYLGQYTSKIKAHEAYVAACKKYHGEFANY